MGIQIGSTTGDTVSDIKEGILTKVIKRYQEAGADYIIRNMSEHVELVNKIS